MIFVGKNVTTGMPDTMGAFFPVSQAQESIAGQSQETINGYG